MSLSYEMYLVLVYIYHHGQYKMPDLQIKKKMIFFHIPNVHTLELRHPINFRSLTNQTEVTLFNK